MKITREEVVYIAKLARLELKDEEILKISKNMEDILAYFEQLQEVDTSSVEPMYHAVDHINVVREDEINSCFENSKPRLFNNAPQFQSHSYKVPKIIGS